MAEPDPPPSLLQIRAMEERVTQACQHVEDVKSPYLLYQERVAALEEKVDREWACVPPKPTQQMLKSVRQNTLRLGGQLRELELRHAATIDEDSKAYRESLEAQVKQLCRDMVDIFGKSLVTETLQEYQTEPVPGSRSGTDGSLAPATAMLQENTQSASQHKNTDLPYSVRFQVATTQASDGIEVQTTSTHSTIPPNSSKPTDSSMPTESSMSTDSSLPTNSKKRKGSFVTGEQPKRARTGQARPTESERTIEFDEIFQGGNAVIKHTIVQFQDEWYILFCEEHGLCFKDHPILSAAKHLNGRVHGQLPKDHKVAIKHLGVRVLNCDAKLAEENNKVCLTAYRKGYNPSKFSMRTEKTSESIQVLPIPEQTGQQVRSAPLGGNGSTGLNGRAKTGRKPRNEFDGIVDPTPGGIYLGYWSKSREWQAVLILPGVATEKSVDIGFTGTVQELGLTEQLPPCYTYDSETGVLDWQEDYQDEGPLVTERQFPVMYFDGLDFPSESSVGWVAANDLQSVDVQDSSFELIPHFKSVLEFLETRSKQAENSNLENMKQTEMRLSPADIGTTAAELPTEQIQEEQPVPPSGFGHDSYHLGDQEAPSSSKEDHTATTSGISLSKADLPHNPIIVPETRHENQASTNVATSSDSSKNAAAASVANTESSPANDPPEPAISPRMSSPPIRPVPTPTLGNRVEKPYSPRSSNLLRIAADSCRLYGFHLAASKQSCTPPIVEGPTHPSQLPNAPRSYQFQENVQAKATETFSNTSPTVQRRENNGQHLEVSSQQHIANDPTSFSQEQPLSSNMVPNCEHNYPAGPQQGSEPSHRENIAFPDPRDLSCHITTGPASYQLPPLNPITPSHTTSHSFSQCQVPDNTTLIDCQEPILTPDHRSVTLPRIAIPSMSAMPSLQSHAVGNLVPNTSPHLLSVPTPNMPSADSASPLMNDHLRPIHQGRLGSGPQQFYPCPYCGKSYSQLVWRDKHIKNIHSAH